MGALRNQIYIGSLDAPTFYFENDNVESVEGIQSVDIIGDKLAIDTFTPVVIYEGDDIDGLRELAFGTPVWHYNNGTLAHKFYIDSVERQSRTKFELTCVSAIGIFDKYYHSGGVYTGQTFSDILEEMIGESIPYEVDSTVADIQMFGYLPYDTCRNNLHQMLFATNVTILKNADGNMYFTYVDPTADISEIDVERLYIDGTVKYPKIATTLNVTEHSYIYTRTIEEVQLADNSSSSAYDQQLLVFDTAPIYVNSLRTEGELTIEESGVNYAILTGTGILYGVPYYDKTTVVTRNKTSRGASYTVSTDECTLVSPANSEFVADRLMEYYTSKKTVTGDIKLAGEKTGKIYRFMDAFGEMVEGYLSKVTSLASSFIKGECEFVSGYEGNNYGNVYTHHAKATVRSNLIIPEGTTRLKLIIISGGDGGSSGYAGTLQIVEDDGSTDYLEAGTGGEAGEPGYGGWIKEVVIENPTPGSYLCEIGKGGSGSQYGTSDAANYLGGEGAASKVTYGNTIYSTDDNDSYRSVYGILDIFDNVVYGTRGIEGVKGGNGGRGSNSDDGDDGDSVVYQGVTYKGGSGAKRLSVKFTIVNDTEYLGGGGGEGAMAFCDGADAAQALINNHTIYGNAETYYGKSSQANRNDYILPADVKTFGSGGRAGCGGAGRGGIGSNGNIRKSSYQSNTTYNLDILVSAPYSGYSKYGTPGGAGASGIVIAYADAPIEMIELEVLTPSISWIINTDRETSNYVGWLRIMDSVLGASYVVEYSINTVNWSTLTTRTATKSGTFDIPFILSGTTNYLIRCYMKVSETERSKYSNECWISANTEKLAPVSRLVMYSGVSDGYICLYGSYSYTYEYAGTKRIGIRTSTDGELYSYFNVAYTYSGYLKGWFTTSELKDHIAEGSEAFFTSYCYVEGGAQNRSDITQPYLVKAPLNKENLSIPHIVDVTANREGTKAVYLIDTIPVDSRVKKIRIQGSTNLQDWCLLKEYSISNSEYKSLKTMQAFEIDLKQRVITALDGVTKITAVNDIYLRTVGGDSTFSVLSAYSDPYGFTIPEA